LPNSFEELDPGQQKFLLGRWLGMTALADRPPVMTDLGERSTPAQEEEERALAQEAKAVRELLETATRNALGEAQPVGAFLSGLPAGIAGLSGSGPGPHPYRLALEQRIAAYETDPIDPFEEVLKRAQEVAVWLYEREGHQPDLPSVRCELSLDRDPPPIPPPPGPAVNGSLESKQSGTVVARLKLTSAKFWWEEMCALTYATLHELVVHAFAAADARNSVDAFAEGWMDYIAFELHQELKGGRLPNLRSPLAADLSPVDQGYDAANLHMARAEGKHLIRRGRPAAEAAHDALRSSGLTPDEARDAIWAFSTALNRSDVDPSRRSEACEAIKRAAAAPGSPVLAAWVQTARDVEAAAHAQRKIEVVTDFVMSNNCNA
jgi:hypothetical protein